MLLENDTPQKFWYAIHTYSGYEHAVERNLKQRIESLEMSEKIFDVVVPTEKKVQIRNGKRIETDEKMLTGYVLVHMIVDEDTWYVVRNTPRVTGFVGAGNTPVPLSEKEVESIFARMKNDERAHSIEMQEGEMIIVAEGPFKDFEGKITGIDTVRGKLKVNISMFGRETPLELDFVQVRKM
jgi:transcription termination/antitermination protein NusG